MPCPSFATRAVQGAVDSLSWWGALLHGPRRHAITVSDRLLACLAQQIC
jgi:hypothetical protein